MTDLPAYLNGIYVPSSDQIGAVASALAKAQGSFGHAAKTNVNPQTKSKYADLAGILDVSRAALADNALSVVQAPYHLPGDPPTVVLVTTLMHESGEWLRSVMPVNPRVKVSGGGGAVATVDDMQTIGSAITYARRYALAAMLGIGQEDDDGNHASGRTRATTAAEAPARPAPAQRAAAAEPAAPEPARAAAGNDQKTAVAELVAKFKEQGVAPKLRLGFIRFITNRIEIKTPLDMTPAELARMTEWSGDQWSAALVDYANEIAGGAPEPDWSDLKAAPASDATPFDPNGRTVERKKVLT